MTPRQLISLLCALVALAADGIGCKGKAVSDDYAKQPPPPPPKPANGSHLKDEEVLAFVNPQKLPVYTGPTGRLEGTVTITGDPSPDVPGLDVHKCPAAKATYEKLFRTGATQSNGARTLADALVVVSNYGPYFLPEREAVKTVEFENCALAARTVDMTVGQRLEVASKDEVLFAPILAQAPQPALMLASRSTAPVALFPPRPGYYTLVDRMELTYLRADVYTLLQPLHTVTSVDGHYRIDGIPVGKVTLSTRLARLRKDASRTVDVVADTVKTVDLTLNFKAATDVPEEATLKRSSMPIP